MADIESVMSGKEPIYVFGYGSLTWKPDFDYDSKMLGYIKGFERRFWQGSTYHRGTLEKPGRCVTLTKVEGSICWGIIYEVHEIAKITAALDYLNVREQKLGGYDVFFVPVFTKGEQQDNDNKKHKVMYSVLYIATEECKDFIGDGPIEKIAESVATSKGKVGHNIEYLFRLSDFMREYLPGVEDDHLFTLDRLVREYVGLSTEENLPWKQLLLNEDFNNLVKPCQNYQNLWKQAIRENMTHKPSIDRWVLLLIQITRMKDLKISTIERFDHYSTESNGGQQTDENKTKTE